MSFSNGLNANGVLQGASMLNRPAEEYVNDTHVEAMWAVQAGEYADLHYNLLCSANPRLLKLTEWDDQLFATFMAQFPGFCLETISEESLKSPAAKDKWRKFCEQMKHIENYSFGTLLRLNSKDEYSADNTILVTRIQFWAIEIARNRLGHNDSVWTYNSRPRNDDDDTLTCEIVKS